PEKPAKGLELLLVEDNLVNQKLAERVLAKMGHKVTIANNGKQGMELATSRKFDLILMDIQMPVMGGLEATARIREEEQKSGVHVPIVAMTAHAIKGDEEKYLSSGMDGYVSKPVNVERLRSEISRLTTEAQDKNSAERTVKEARMGQTL